MSVLVSDRTESKFEAGYYDAQKAQETRRQSEKRGDNV